MYHVMIRGVNKQSIFLDPEDYLRFLRILSEIKKRCKHTIHGYCLMDNHVHLLLQEDAVKVGAIMQRIGTSYVKWHNKKHQRVGHLFQNRFLSEAVDNDTYLKTLLRYIHQNPVKANIVTSCDAYPWSSYTEYITPEHAIEPGLTDTALGLELLGGKAQFVEYCRVLNPNPIALEDPLLFKTEIARTVIKRFTENQPVENLIALKITERNALIRKLKAASGLSCPEIAKLTGFSIGIVKRALSEKARAAEQTAEHTAEHTAEPISEHTAEHAAAHANVQTTATAAS